MVCVCIISRGLRKGQQCNAKSWIHHEQGYCKRHAAGQSHDVRLNDQNLFYNLPGDIQEHIHRYKYIPDILSLHHKLKPYHVIEGFRKHQYMPLNHMYNKTTDDMLIKLWCIAIKKCSKTVIDKFVYEFYDVDYVHGRLMISNEPNDIATYQRLLSSVKDNIFQKIHIKHGIHVTKANEFVSTLYNHAPSVTHRSNINRLGVSEMESIDVAKLEVMNMCELKSMFDRYTRLDEAYQHIMHQFMMSTISNHNVTVDVIAEYCNIMMYRHILSILDTGLLVCQRCCTDSCNNITKSIHPYCKKCKDALNDVGIELKKPFDLDMIDALM